jgi:hypothetical protein
MIACGWTTLSAASQQSCPLPWRYGSKTMKYIILFIAMIPAFVQAEVICKDFEQNESNAFNWSESDFNAKSATESMATLQEALNDNGSIGTCHLPNAVSLVQGYILKQQALSAISSKETSELIIKYNVAGFCGFISQSKPCE